MDNNLEYEEVVLTIPKKSFALVITSVHGQKSELEMSTTTFDTNQIKGFTRYEDESEVNKLIKESEEK